ncbi:hypothetical protein SK128_025802, partial [Halocaridina rubra]
MGDVRMDSVSRFLTISDGGKLKDGENGDAHETDSGIHSGDDVVDRTHSADRTERDGRKKSDCDESETGNCNDIKEFLRRGETVVELYNLDLDAEESAGHGENTLDFHMSATPQIDIVNQDDGERAIVSRKNVLARNSQEGKKKYHRPLAREDSVTADFNGDALPIDNEAYAKDAESFEMQEVDISEKERKNADNINKAKTLKAKQSNIETESLESPDMTDTKMNQEECSPQPEIRFLTDSGSFCASVESSESVTKVPEVESKPSHDSLPEETVVAASPMKKHVAKSLSDGTILSDSSRLRIFQRLESRGGVPAPCGIPFSLEIQEESLEDLRDDDEARRSGFEHPRFRPRFEKRNSKLDLKDTLAVPGERRTSRVLEFRARGSRRESMGIGISPDNPSVSSVSTPEDEEGRRLSQIRSSISPGKD